MLLFAFFIFEKVVHFDMDFLGFAAFRTATISDNKTGDSGKEREGRLA